MASVRQLLSEQFPSLALHSIDYLGSGWEHDVYLVNRTFVFRFPRYADVAENLDYDKAVLDLVGASVRDAVVVPKIIILGQGSVAFPHRFFGHELVPGLGADDPRVPRPIALASDLGAALTAIHAISTDSAMEVGVGTAGGDCRAPFDALMRQVPLVAGLRELAPGPFEWLHEPPAAPAAYAGPPRFIHNDLHGEHIIVHAGTGRLSGIVDWSAPRSGTHPSTSASFWCSAGGLSWMLRLPRTGSRSMLRFSNVSASVRESALLGGWRMH